NRLAADDATLVHFGGHFARGSRSAHAAEQVLSRMTACPVRVEQFVGCWLPIATADQSRLPSRARPRGSFCQLGESAVIGRRVYDVQSTVRLVIGPLQYPAFRALLPDGANAGAFVDLAAVTLGPDITFRLCILLAAGDVPAL